ncbi:MAG: phage holin family protein [Flavobacteriaceae bacterium]|jgi:putative membrane protein
MKTLIRWLINSLGVIVIAEILPGVEIKSFFTAMAVALVLSILNLIVKPILIVLTLPITILSLGIFLLIINALIIQLASSIVPNFMVSSLWTALIYSLLLSVMQSFLQGLFETDRQDHEH